MKTTLDFLEAVKTKHGLTSDYQLSKHLECTRGAISSYRMKKSFMDEEMACKIADDLGLEAGFVLSCIAAERSKNPQVKKAWAWTAQHLGGLAAALALVAVLPAIPMGYDGFNVAFFGTTEADSAYYVKSLVGVLASHWYLSIPLALLAIHHFPRHNPRPKKPRT